MTTTYTHIYTDTNPITLPCSLARAGNKAFRRSGFNQADNSEPLVERTMAIAIARKIGAYVYFECSAKENDGVRALFGMAFKAIVPGNKQKDSIKYKINSKVILN